MNVKTNPTILFCEESSPRLGSVHYTHFFQHPKGVLMCRDRKSRDTPPLLEAEVSEGTDTPDSYWGWWDGEKRRFIFVFHRRMLVEMCFPYGTEAEEKLGRGRLLPVNIKILKRWNQNDKPWPDGIRG